jgi:hypothetical protein
MEIFNNVTPTASYADNTVDTQKPFDQESVLFVDYTKGDETSIQLKFQFANKDQAGDYFDPSTADNSGNVTVIPPLTFSATGKYRIAQPAGGVVDDDVTVALKRTGGSGSGCHVTVYHE